MPDYHVTIDLGNIRAPAERAVTKAVYMAHIGTSRLDGLGEVVATLGTDLALKYQAPRLYQTHEDMVADYKWWLLSGIFREVVEAVGECCTAAYFHLLVLDLMRPSSGGTTTGESYNERVMAPLAAYRSLVGLPRKLNSLEKLSPGVLPQLTEHARSVNSARNCLVHNHGIVGETHANTPRRDALRVRWRSPSLVKRALNGVEHSIRVGDVIGEGEQVGVRWSDAEKVFRLGERVEFTEDELVGVCFGVTAFAEALRANVETAGRVLGWFSEEGEET